MAVADDLGTASASDQHPSYTHDWTQGRGRSLLGSSQGLRVSVWRWLRCIVMVMVMIGERKRGLIDTFLTFHCRSGKAYH